MSLQVNNTSILSRVTSPKHSLCVLLLHLPEHVRRQRPTLGHLHAGYIFLPQQARPLLLRRCKRARPQVLGRRGSVEKVTIMLPCNRSVAENASRGLLISTPTMLVKREMCTHLSMHYSRCDYGRSSAGQVPVQYMEELSPSTPIYDRAFLIIDES